ncbi:uncharacterized protein LOC105648221 [Jatropha curcas]|nr:uncharacterized protein LOC105648221 [Jatropha curcas]
MASSVPSYLTAIKKSHKQIITTTRRQAVQVRAHSFRDEGSSSDLVEANLSVLKERIMEVKMKERLERCCKCEYGWNYSSGYNYNYKLKKQVGLSQIFDVVSLVFGTIGFTCISCSFSLLLVSIVIHLNQ